MKTSFHSAKDHLSLSFPFFFLFVFCIFTISTKHALYNIVLLYHSINYSFHLKLWSIYGLDL